MGLPVSPENRRSSADLLVKWLNAEKSSWAYLLVLEIDGANGHWAAVLD
jgi:hypothetical protein